MKIFPALLSAVLAAFTALAPAASAGSRAQRDCSPVLLVGGGARPADALSAWLAQASASRDGKLVVIAWASGEPEESFEAIRAELLLAGAPSRIVLSARAPGKGEDVEKFLQELSGARLAWITGGDQNRIADVLDRFPELGTAIRRRVREGSLALGGTSAGTAIQARQIFTGNEDLTRIDPEKIALRAGLGTLPGYILVDQHFLRRQRQNRLISALLAGAARIGLGIDEDNALLIRDCDLGTPYGTSPLSVYRVDPSMPNRLALEFFFAGETIDLSR